MKITKRQLRRIIKEEKDKLLAEQPGPTGPKGTKAAAGLQAVADIYDAIARLQLVLEDLREKARGMEYDSMDLALSSLSDMKTEVHLDRIETRLGRITSEV
jgi:hypothetical protein